VQTPAQLEMLRTLGCTLAQGPLLCGPIDASALTRRIRSGECMPRSLGSACRSASPLNA
jgi:EAL domain-containing protein (putative c-di-GMP-specific phosphodiesterase class I)